MPAEGAATGRTAPPPPHGNLDARRRCAGWRAGEPTLVRTSATHAPSRGGHAWPGWLRAHRRLHTKHQRLRLPQSSN